MTVTEDGAVIENLEIRGTLRIEARNVVVRNTWVYTSAPWTIYVASGSATIDHVEVGHGSVIGERGIGGSNVVVTSADIHHVEDGIKLGSNAVYSGVRVHDLASHSSSPHADAVQVEGTSHNSVVRSSVLSATGPVGLGNAAAQIKTDLGTQKNLSFVGNYMNGGNYTIFVREGKHGLPTGVLFKNNRFGPSRRYGIISKDGPVLWENNTMAETGELVNDKGEIVNGEDASVAPTVPTTTTPATTTTKPRATAAPSSAQPTEPLPSADNAPAGPTTTTTKAPVTVARATPTTIATTTTAPLTSTTTENTIVAAAPLPPSDDDTSRTPLALVLVASSLGIVALSLAGYRSMLTQR